MEMNCSAFMSSFYHSIQNGDRGGRGDPGQCGGPTRSSSAIVSQLLNIDRMIEMASASALSESSYI